MTLGFEVLAREGAARRGRLVTAHGVVETPVFMPVGTAATVKAMTAEGVAATGARLVLGNTYHLMLRPGAERIAALGGLHRFMNWPHAILTDSGGFQVMSLAKLRKIGEDGVTFRSHLDGSAHLLTPERSIEIQRLLGADVTMALDECTPYPSPPRGGRSLDGIVDALGRALAPRLCSSGRATASSASSRAGFIPTSGSTRRRASSRSGLTATRSAGSRSARARRQPSRFSTRPCRHCRADRPRYLMGVGKPADLVGAVMRGIDMFDCVLPTRSGRTAQAFTRRGTLNLRNARHADDPAPLDPECRCPACAGYSRAYLHHLCRSGEILGAMLLTAHNLHYYADLMADMRGAIENGALADFAAAFAEAQTPSPPETRE